jgi:hypothetical protein
VNSWGNTNVRNNAISTKLNANLLEQFLQGSISLPSSPLSPSSSTQNNKKSQPIVEAEELIQSFISTLNGNDNDNDSKSAERMVIKYFDDDVTYADTSFYNPIQGTDDLLRHFLLTEDPGTSTSSSTSLSVQRPYRKNKIVIDDIATGFATFNMDNDDKTINVCVQYHLEELLSESESKSNSNSGPVPDSKGITFYTIQNQKITSVFDVMEPPSPKPGDAGLKLLEKASSVLSLGNGSNDNNSDSDSEPNDNANMNIVEKYFDSWNKRDMKTAVECFTTDCKYEDLQYDTPFEGKETMEQHLLNVAKCLPSSFAFQIDNMVVDSSSSDRNNDEKVGVLWHVENDDKELPFTRGCSFYTTTTAQQKGSKVSLIQTGVDIPEPAVIKKGIFNTISKQFESEPIRFLPATIWALYMYIVFVSDGILPGANALSLEQRTWEEVRDLSLNFFLVSPLLHLPFAPTVHPMLEGVFNLLLAWAGMFAGFLSDERKEKPNLLPFGPIVIGMQFLTSAFLLPYLALRSSEKDYDTTSATAISTRSSIGDNNDRDMDDTTNIVYKEDITGSVQALVGEWKPLGALLGGVGTSSILWGLLARPEFGTNFSERYVSFVELLSIDRVGSSFLVDLAIFALFQGWFVDDDLKRRGVDTTTSSNTNNGMNMVVLKNVAKFVPFFGLALYLSFRPDLPSREQQQQ